MMVGTSCGATELNGPRTIQRGASNVHFSNLISSILIPPYSKSIRVYLDGKPRTWKRIERIFTNHLNNIDGKYQLNPTGQERMEEEALDSGFEVNIFVETAKNKWLEIKKDPLSFKTLVKTMRARHDSSIAVHQFGLARRVFE